MHLPGNARRSLVAVAVCLLATLISENSHRPTTARARDAPAGEAEAALGPPVLVEMKNLEYHADDSIVLRIPWLRGALLPTRKGVPPTFDDPQSFILRIDAGEIGIRTAHLTSLINRYVLNDPASPLKNLTTRAEGSRLKHKGLLKKGVPISFSAITEVGTTADGNIRLHPTSIKAAGIPVQGLLHLFGLELENLVRLKQDRGMKIEGEDLILEPARILPSPEARGRVTSVQVRGDELVQVFGSADQRRVESLSPPDPRAPNYMYYHGAVLRFGKLTMSGTDLQIIDAHPSDPFDFSLQHYNEHLVAGYSKNTPNHGLMVYMPDFRQLRTPRAGGLRPSRGPRGILADRRAGP